MERGTGAEFEGSPLRALRMHALGRRDLHFTHAHFVNASPDDHRALEARVARLYEARNALVPPANVKL